MIKVYVILAVIALAVLVVVNFVVFNQGNSLVFVNVFFRHGQKSLTFNYTYTNDPNQEASYSVYGPGQLTLEGKKHMYSVGEYLRLRYDKYLGDIYTKDIVQATSSDFTRTQESMQSVLAALFPPVEPYHVDKDLKWQPVIYDVLKFQEDDMIAFWGKCTEYLKYDDQLFFQTDEVKKIDDEFMDVYEYISENTGDNITSLYDLGFLYHTFQVQENFGLQLPEWTKKVYPYILDILSKERWKATVSTHYGIKYSAGKLLRTISNSFLDKIKEKLPDDRKMNIFAGHDYGICGLLAALNISHDFSLPYGAYIIIELHKISGVYGVKVYYQDDKKFEPVLQTIGNCTSFCPLEHFINITRKYYPNPNICLDDKSLEELHVIL